MPLRPFPLPLNLGTDICHIPRFSKYFRWQPPTTPSTSPSSTGPSTTGAGTPLFHLFDKFLLPSEQRTFWKRFGPLESLQKLQGRREAATCWIAGRWAAKEAIIKAHAPIKRVLLRNVEIRTLATGQPYGVVLDDTTKASKAEDLYAAYTLETRTGLSGLDVDRGGSKTRDGGEIPESGKTQDGGEMREGERMRKGGVYDELNAHLRAKENGTDADADANAEEDINGQIVKLSISHDGEYCTAVALAAVEVTVPGLGL